MPSVCSLFSGIGGIDLGFIQAGFDIVWANEKDAAACRTYRHNLKGSPLVEGDIHQIPVESINIRNKSNILIKACAFCINMVK